MRNANVGSALLGAAMLAQLAVPAASAAVAPAVAAFPAMPLALLDAQETPPAPDEEPLDTEPAPGAEPPAGQPGTSEPAGQPSGDAAAQAPVDDTETMDQGSRPEAPPPAPAPVAEPAPAPVAEPAPAPVTEPAPAAAGPVAAEPVPAGPVDVAVGDSSGGGDSYGYVDSAEESWPFMYDGSIFLNAGYGPGEANAETGYDSCEYQTTNGRAYVGIHCADGNLVAGFTPPPWKTAEATAAQSGLAGANDDFWSRVNGEGGAIRVPVPGTEGAPADARIIEGRSRERTKTVTITRNGESETVTNSGKNNNADTPKDGKNNGKGGKNDNKNDDGKKNRKSSAQDSEKESSGASSGKNDSGSGKSSQDLSSGKHGKKDRKKHAPERRKSGIVTEQAAAVSRPSKFAACVQQSILNPGVNLNCGELISAGIDESLGRDTGE